MDFELYFAGMRFRSAPDNKDQYELNKFMFDNGCNCLLSYTNDKKEIIERFNRPDYKGKFFIDSGAFSLWTKGKHVDVDEYIVFLNEHKEQIDLHGQVDIIPGVRGHVATPEQVAEAAKLTWENYLYMIERLDHPEKCLYTFHMDEPFEYLKQALEWKNSKGELIPYIALGGMVGRVPSARKQFLKGVFETIKYSSNPNVKVHAFGMTSRRLLKLYPNITSADSTSWLKFAAVGSIQTKYKDSIVRIGERVTGLMTHPTHLPEEAKEDFENYLKEHGFTLEELGENSYKRMQFNVIYNIELQQRVIEARKQTPQTNLYKLF